MKRFFIAALFLLSLVAGSTFAADEASEDNPYSDPAKPIEARTLSEFSIILESNPTTGFGWDISKPLDEKTVCFVSSEYVAAETGLAGSGGREIWTFRAIAPGKTAISFKYFRPWEKDVPPSKELVFNVSIRQEK
jgi:inhibitor of cysteine peptidase